MAEFRGKIQQGHSSGKVKNNLRCSDICVSVPSHKSDILALQGILTTYLLLDSVKLTLPGGEILVTLV